MTQQNNETTLNMIISNNGKTAKVIANGATLTVEVRGEKLNLLTVYVGHDFKFNFSSKNEITLTKVNIENVLGVGIGYQMVVYANCGNSEIEIVYVPRSDETFLRHNDVEIEV